jgi:hypothetical protein
LNITSEVWIFADFQCSPCGSAVCWVITHWLASILSWYGASRLSWWKLSP